MPPRLERAPSWFKVFLVFASLYLFMVGIGAMGASFKLMGNDLSKDLLAHGNRSPLVALFIGILATTLVQSSSTSTSILIGLVAAGIVPWHTACFMVMGANVGTTVTNTLVSLGHITRSGEYRRAFAAATVHDFFNLLVLVILFPLELYTGVLSTLATALTEAFRDVGATKLADPVKAVTRPAIDLIQSVCLKNGIATLVVAIVLTFGMLVLMVKALKSLMIARLENLFDTVIFKTPRRSLAFGVALTVLVQSSSITTSIAVPLVGAGILTVTQILPYTMGANIGTTVTGLLAALGAMASAGDPATALVALNVAFFHVLFNVLGVAIWWWFRRVPIAIAEGFAKLAIRNRLIPLVYIVLVFYVIPFLVIFLYR